MYIHILQPTDTSDHKKNQVSDFKISGLRGCMYILCNATGCCVDFAMGYPQLIHWYNQGHDTTSMSLSLDIYMCENLLCKLCSACTITYCLVGKIDLWLLTHRYRITSALKRLILDDRMPDVGLYALGAVGKYIIAVQLVEQTAHASRSKSNVAEAHVWASDLGII